ncbi:hypothetical protein BDZ45DRAFT_598464 [Acephala macrosclerotiorum]|nr:hypothetical protein BDZ45DRAFT_598464 [Acephala macrosclerotiorum]
MTSTYRQVAPLNDEPDVHVAQGYQLSFGVELEFNVAALRDGERNPDPQDAHTVYGILPPGAVSDKEQDRNSTHSHIAKSLNERFKDMPLFNNGIVQPYDFRAIGGDMDPRGLRSYQQWIVKDDVTIRPPATDEGSEAGDPVELSLYDFVPVEIASPALWFSAEALNHVQQVVKYLDEKYRVIITESCGMHVHIGQGFAGFSLPHLKKIFAILWTFEHLFYFLVGKSRFNNVECSYMAEHSLLARRFGGDSPATAKAGLQKILSATSVNQLCELLGNRYGRLGFNIKGLDDEEEGFDKTKQTIEIRLHESTLNPEAIYHWVHVFKGVVGFANVIEGPDLETWLRDHIGQAPDYYDPFRLLNALRLPHQAGYYATKTLLKLDDSGWNTSLGRAAQAELGI